MTIEQMRLFITLCDMMNFTRAAEKSYITQEGLSYQIRRMEKELGYPLFYRRHNQLELTEAGEKWRVSIESILHLYDKTELSVQDDINNHNPLINISFYGYEYSFLIELVRQFQIKRPEIRYRVLTEKDGNLFQMLCDQKVDILYAGRELITDYSMLGFEQIGQGCNGFVLNRTHQLSSKPSLSWADVASETLIIPSILTSDPMKSYNLSFQRILSEHCPSARILYASDFSAALVMVALGMGIIPTTFDVRHAGKNIGENCIHIPRKPIRNISVGIAYHTGNPKQYVWEFLEFVHQLNGKRQV